MSFRYITQSNTGLKRSENEDALGVFEIDGGMLVVVCDGLGGNKAGDVASKLAVKTIASRFKEAVEKDILERIKDAILEANRTVLEESNKDFDMKGMATTVEALFLKDDHAYWGHVGDSRIYYFKKSKLKQLSKDHSLVQKLVDEGYLTLKEAEHHPNKNIIMRALGDNVSVEVDLSKLKISSSDYGKFFLCSDGVTTVVNDSELEELLSGNDFDQISDELSNLVEERGAPDNYSFVILTRDK